jgi:hypothetical protein
VKLDAGTFRVDLNGGLGVVRVDHQNRLRANKATREGQRDNSGHKVSHRLIQRQLWSSHASQSGDCAQNL